MTRSTYMCYAEFFEYISRYVELARQNKVERIPYDVYKPLMKYLKETSLTSHSGYMVYIDVDYDMNRAEIMFSGENIRTFSLGPAESEFVDALIDWREYEYPYPVEFTPISLYEMAYCDVRGKYVHDLDYCSNSKKLNCELGVPIDKMMNNKIKQEEKTMKANFNFDFGVLSSGYVKMSPYGIAVESCGTWKAFDRNSNSIVDVGDFTFKMDGAFFKMPVAIDAIQKGDMLIFKDEPVYVIGKDGDGFKVVDIAGNEQKTIMPTKNIFGFNYMTKVVSMFDNMGFGNMMAPSAEHPFGNMMPLMMMQMLSDNDSFNMGGDMGKMMMMSMMMGGQNPMANMFSQFAPSPAPAQIKQDGYVAGTGNGNNSQS